MLASSMGLAESDSRLRECRYFTTMRKKGYRGRDVFKNSGSEGMREVSLRNVRPKICSPRDFLGHGKMSCDPQDDYRQNRT